MAKERKKAGAATEPVDASQIPQESETGKVTREQVPSRTGMATRGYVLPESHYALEEAGGDLEKAAQIMRDSDTGPKTQAEINAAADKEQQANQQKNAGGPPENKNAGGPAANKAAATETTTAPAEDYSGHLKAALETEAATRGLTVKGTGADGAILADDLRKALVKDDRQKAQR